MCISKILRGILLIQQEIYDTFNIYLCHTSVNIAAHFYAKIHLYQCILFCAHALHTSTFISLFSTYHYLSTTFEKGLLSRKTRVPYKYVRKIHTWGVFTCSILASIVTILISIVLILTSIEPILEKCVHLQVLYS